MSRTYVSVILAKHGNKLQCEEFVVCVFMCVCVCVYIYTYMHLKRNDQ